MIFVGDDSAENHHDVHVMDEAGLRLSSRRLPKGVPRGRRAAQRGAAFSVADDDASTRILIKMADAFFLIRMLGPRRTGATGFGYQTVTIPYAARPSRQGRRLLVTVEPSNANVIAQPRRQPA